MTDFGECLKRLLLDGQWDIRTLAMRSGIPEKALTGYVRGKGIPAQADFQRLLAALPLTVQEQAQFSHSYYVSCVGEWTYHRRAFLKEQLSGLAQLEHLHHSDSFQTSMNPAGFRSLPEEGIRIFQGPFEVEKALYQSLSEELCLQENPSVCTNAFLYQNTLRRILLGLYLSRGGRMELRHIIPFTKDTGSSLSNLVALFGALSFCLAPGGAYRPSFYYSDAPPYADSSAPFAFYLYTHNRLLWLSQDLETVALISNQELLKVYQERFERAAQFSRPLVYQARTAEEMIAAGHRFYNLEAPCQIFSMELQPCLGPFLTKDILMRCVNHEEKGTDALAEQLNAYYDSVSPYLTCITSICWERGLNLFIDEGRLCAFPPAYAHAVSPQDRWELLNRFYEKVLEGKVALYFVNEALFPFSESFSLHCMDTEKANIEVHDLSAQLYASIVLEEQSLCFAFSDFVRSMPEGEWTYSREASLEILRRGIARCQQIAGVQPGIACAPQKAE